MIIPVCHDDDNNGMETRPLTITDYTAATGITCVLPQRLTVRDRVYVDCGGFTRAYSSANERGFEICIKTHGIADLNTELTEGTTSYTMGDADTLSRRFVFTPHSDVVTQAGTTKKPVYIGIRCTGASANGTMACQGFLGFVLKGA
jgi:hypothetical protein